MHDSKVGCYIGQAYVGALAYADDVILLAPTSSHANDHYLANSGHIFCCFLGSHGRRHMEGTQNILTAVFFMVLHKSHRWSWK